MPLNELPADDGTLYIMNLDGAPFGIGTADEIRAQADELPHGMTFAVCDPSEW